MAKVSLTLVDIDPRTGTDSSGAVETQPGISGTGDKVTQEGTPVVRGTPVDEPYLAPDGYISRLAIVTLHVILGKASVWFPTSDRAAPSLEVAILATVAKLSVKFNRFFPTFVRWDHWEYGVVPVIQDVANQKKAARIKILLDRKDYDEVLKLLTGEIIKSFRDRGFLPTVENTGTGEPSTSVESSATSAASLPRKKQAGSAPITDE